MTTAPAARPTSPAASRPPAGGAIAGSFTPAIDPVKLLQKYMWLLIAASVGGLIIGEITFQIWKRVAPTWTSTTVFEVQVPTTDLKDTATRYDEEELMTFMATRMEEFSQPALLDSVILDPRVQTEAPAWIRKYEKNGSIDVDEARRDLRDIVSTQIIQDTQLFTMSVGWRTPSDAAGLARMLEQKFITSADERARRDRVARLDQIRRIVDGYNEELDELVLRRTRLSRDEGISAESQREDDASKELDDTVATISEIQQEMAATREQLQRMETMLQNDSAIQYTDTQRAMVDQSPLVMRQTSSIQDLRTELGAMLREGIQPAHRDYRLLQARIDAAEAELIDLRERELRKQFEADVDALRQMLRGLQAQEADLQARAGELRARLTELTRIYKELDQLDVRIERVTETRDTYQESLEEIQSLGGLQRGRIVTVQAPKVPDEISSPNHIVTLALGLILVTGLTGGAVVARELLDQRIKGPSDVAMIPRTKVVGVVPLAAEDPNNPKHFETIFRDQPRGVLSESLRQVRTTVLKKMERGGHKSLLVCSGLPRSGATGTITNLAFAAAAADKKVLVIDANFRRPGVHRVFGLAEAPGLADVLAGRATLDSTVQATDTKGLSVLPVGSAEDRVFERLGTQPMGDLLDRASEKYDLVLIDTAPAVVAGDALSIATRCDAVMMVVRAMAEKRGMVNRIKNDLADGKAELLGVLVNGVRASAGGYMKRNIRATHEYQDGAAASASIDEKA